MDKKNVQKLSTSERKKKVVKEKESADSSCGKSKTAKRKRSSSNDKELESLLAELDAEFAKFKVFCILQ